MNYIKIVEHFKTITSVYVNKNNVHISGITNNNKLNTLKISYKHTAVAKAVSLKLRNFINV